MWGRKPTCKSIIVISTIFLHSRMPATPVMLAGSLRLPTPHSHAGMLTTSTKPSTVMPAGSLRPPTPHSHAGRLTTSTNPSQSRWQAHYVHQPLRGVRLAEAALPVLWVAKTALGRVLQPRCSHRLLWTPSDPEADPEDLRLSLHVVPPPPLLALRTSAALSMAIKSAASSMLRGGGLQLLPLMPESTTCWSLLTALDRMSARQGAGEPHLMMTSTAGRCPNVGPQRLSGGYIVAKSLSARMRITLFPHASSSSPWVSTQRPPFS